MDIAYDHIQEEALSSPEESSKQPPRDENQPSSPTLDSDFQEAFRSVSSSPWGTTIGGWFNSARKQGESLYNDLQREASEAQVQATKGFTTLKEQVVNRTRSLSLNAEPEPQDAVPGEEALPNIARVTSRGSADAAQAEAEALQAQREKSESLHADIVKEAGTLVASLRSTAASKLKDLQRAEDAADEALLKFGTNVRNFLRDAVTITAPDDTAIGAENEVLFETQEPGTGKKVFHSTRLDAQLHAIHSTATSFTEDPASGQHAWEDWKQSFDVDGRTNEVAKDLDRYGELRKAMERLVPEKVDYKTFWMRYYFLRKAIDEEERRRREVLKGAATDPEEEVAWDEDSDDERARAIPNPTGNKAASESTTTLNAPAANSGLKPKSPRRSIEDNKSVADSDASYDVVSGATSQATSSPKEKKREEGKDEESDEDWE